MLRSVLAVGLLLLAGTVAPAPVRATNTLSNGTVSPGSGTTSTVFTFSVAYLSQSPARTPTSVTANVASLSIPLALTSGEPTDGIYSGSSALPAGTWPVTFLATVTNGDATLDVAPVQVTPAATPSPTVPPTATPAPTPPPRTPPPTVTPSPAPRATPTPGTRPPPTTPTPATAISPPATAPSSGGTPSTGPGGSPGSAAASGSPRASDGRSPNPAPSSSPPGPSGAPTDGPTWRFGRGAWLLLGGTLSVAGAGILAGQWVRTRRKRPSATRRRAPS